MRGSSSPTSWPGRAHVARNTIPAEPSGSCVFSPNQARATSAASPSRASTSSVRARHVPGWSRRAAENATASRMRPRRSLSSSARLRSVISRMQSQNSCSRPFTAAPSPLALSQRVRPSATGCSSSL